MENAVKDPHAALKAFGGPTGSFHARPIKNGYISVAHHANGKSEEIHHPNLQHLANHMHHHLASLPAELPGPAAVPGGAPPGPPASPVMAGGNPPGAVLGAP